MADVVDWGYSCFWDWEADYVRVQMIPSQLKFSMEGATPSFADNEGQIVEAGSQVRLRIKGIRSELNQMYAIGSIREDYLGYEKIALPEQVATIADKWLVLSCSSNLAARSSLLPALLSASGAAALLIMFVTAVYHHLDFSEALEIRVKAEKNTGEGSCVLCLMLESRYPIGMKNADVRNVLSSHMMSLAVSFSARSSSQGPLYRPLVLQNNSISSLDDARQLLDRC